MNRCKDVLQELDRRIALIEHRERGTVPEEPEELIRYAVSEQVAKSMLIELNILRDYITGQ
ncbi:MAG: hypothetical protein ACI4PQ_09460 [Butyricicoccaceae bacterium]